MGCLRLLLILLLALLVGCDPVRGPGSIVPGGAQDGMSQTIPLVTGLVEDAAHRPVAGAAVRAFVAPYQLAGFQSAGTPALTTTDAGGRFSFAALEPGTYAIEATRPTGDKALRTRIAVAAGQPVALGALMLLPTGTLRGRVQGPSELLGTDVFIPGTDYLAKADASGSYTLAGVPAGTYDVAAMRQNYLTAVQTGVEVAADQVSTVPDLVLALDAPILSYLNPESGAPGVEVTIRGTHLGETRQTTVSVSFGDTLATTLRRISDTEIRAVVPAEAVRGPVIVRSGGVASNALPFQVITKLSLAPSEVQLTPEATAALALAATDLSGAPVPGPVVSWAVDDPVVATVAAGTVVGRHGGITRVSASNGIACASAWIGVSGVAVTTPYGNGNGRSGLADEPVAEAALAVPTSLGQDSRGNLYVLQNRPTAIRRIDASGMLRLVAGNGVSGDAGDGGPATEASLGDFSSFVIDEQDRLWFSDSGHSVVRLVPLDDRDPRFRAGHIYRVAGTGVDGYSGPDLEATASALHDPRGMWPRPEGLYLADYTNHRIRRLTADFRLLDVLGTGQDASLTAPTPAGVAPVGRPRRVQGDAAGNLFVLTETQLLVWCRQSGTYHGLAMQAGIVYPLLAIQPGSPFVGDGPSAVVGPVSGITDLAVSPDGELILMCGASHTIRRLTREGRLETLVGRPLEAIAGRVQGLGARSGPGMTISVNSPIGLTWVPGGFLCSDQLYHVIRRVAIAAD